MSLNHVFDEVLVKTQKQETLLMHNFDKLEKLLSWMPTNRMIFSDLQMLSKNDRTVEIANINHEKQVALIHQIFNEIDTLEQDLSLFDLGSYFFQQLGEDGTSFATSFLGRLLHTVNQTLNENDIQNWITRGIVGYYLIVHELKEEPFATIFAHYFLNYNIAYTYPKSAMIFSIGTENPKNIHNDVFEKLNATLEILWNALIKYLHYDNFNTLQKITLERLFNIGYAVPFQQSMFQNVSRTMSQNLFTTGSSIVEKEESLSEIDVLKNQNFIFTHQIGDELYALLNLKKHNSSLYTFQNNNINTPAMQQHYTRKETIGKIAGKAYFG